MPKLRHLAIVAKDPEALARFYTDVFAMKIIDRTPTGAVSLSDGSFNLTFLPQRAEGKPCGLNHFGFEVEDHEEITRRLAKGGIKPPAKRPADRPYAETRATDPDGNNFDISVKGFGSEETTAAPRKEPAPV
jgi:catechol 2,3-dioxygenase-like lactoylglutathione lyase family enzyme